MREHGALHLNLHRMHLNKRVIGRIFQVGLPAGFQGVIFSLSNVVIQSSINSFGDTVMAGSAAAQNIEGFLSERPDLQRAELWCRQMRPRGQGGPLLPGLCDSDRPDPG